MNRSIVLALTAFSLLPGCLGDQVLGLTPEPRASGLWAECTDAAVHGLSGDPCTFATQCSSVAELGPDAFCRPDGWLVINTRETVAVDPIGVPRVLDDGCIEHAAFGVTRRLCVEDAMLPFAPRETPIDFDQSGACAQLPDATPGFPCSGTTICALGHVENGFGTLGTVPLSFRPGILAWCHGNRIRTAATILTMPCESTATTGFVSCAY